jgi:hypothetical protein
MAQPFCPDPGPSLEPAVLAPFSPNWTQGVLMRIVSRPFARAGVSARSYFLMVLGVLVLGWATAGCEDKHIGRPCLTNADAGSFGATGQHVTVISSPNLQCPSRICMLPYDNNTAAMNHDGAFCTYSCETDDDCSDAETGSLSVSDDTRCKGNFICEIATTSGPFCCQKFCMCHDFVYRPAGGNPVPAACMSGSQTCANVH